MRKVEIGTGRYTEVNAVDEPEFNANHEYEITAKDPEITFRTIVQFQKGPIKENGVNGCHHEDLIAIVIDRLQSFQNSKFMCMENQNAIGYLENALNELNSRTKDRKERKVEGTSEV